MPYSKNIYSLPPTLIQYPRGISYSKNPLYVVLESPDTYTTIVKPENYTIICSLLNHYNDFSVTGIVDNQFELFGKLYKSVDKVTAKKQYLKSYNYNAVRESIYVMLKNDLIFDDYIIEWGGNTFSSGYHAPSQTTYYKVDFVLTQKTKGRPIRDVFRETNNNSDEITVGKYRYKFFKKKNSTEIYGLKNTGTELKKDINNNNTYSAAVTETTLEHIMPASHYASDTKNYESQVELYKVFGNFIGGVKTEYITTLSKKRTQFSDFNLQEIVDSEIVDYKPNFSTIMQNKVLKNLEAFGVKYLHKYVDNQDDDLVTDVNKNYPETIYNNFLADYDFLFYGIQASEALFENPNDGNVSKPDLLYVNSGTYGVVANKIICDINLTKQPNTKTFNKKYELLSVINQNIFNNTNDDVFKMKLYFDDDTTETINFNSNVSNTALNYYINYFVIDKDLIMSNSTSGKVLNNLKKMDVNFYSPSFNGYAVNYETQTYIFDNIETCDDVTEDDDYVTLVYKNSYGSFDVFDFNTFQEIKVNKDVKIIESQYDYTAKKDSQFNYIYSQDYQKSYTINSRILTTEEYAWLEDLIKSDRVYLLEKDSKLLMPVVINKNNYNFKVNTDLILELEFSFSRREII
jgi:hypothetical protein